MRLTRTSALLAGAALALPLLAACSNDRAGHTDARPAVANADDTKQDELRLGMHRLWEDHIVWTRLFILAAADAAPDTDLVAKRLLKNQDDIGDAIKPYYGDAAGAELTRLLREHILVAADLVGAAKAGNTAKVTTTKTTWYANGDQVADFLAKANPEHWPATEMRPMMREHLDHTLDEAVHRLQGDYAADIADYDLIHTQILHMADMLADGIIAAHPDKFA